MAYLTVDRIQEAKQALTQRMVADFVVDLLTVVYDATNFYTWMNSQTPSELAQRGHQKPHRTDLRTVGLAVLVTTDFNIPLFHTVFPGNRHDSVQFASVTEALIERYQALRTHCGPITLVYDKGDNSPPIKRRSRRVPMASSGP